MLTDQQLESFKRSAETRIKMEKFDIGESEKEIARQEFILKAIAAELLARQVATAGDAASEADIIDGKNPYDMGAGL